MENPLETTVILFVILALGVGALIGWLVGSRNGAASKEVTESLRLQLDGITGERDAHRAEAETSRSAHSETLSELAGYKATQEERDHSFTARLADFKTSEEETKTRLNAQFSEISGKLLGEAQKAFLERADARFHQAGEKHEEKLKTLLQPVETTLKRYEEGLQRVEKEREGSYRELYQAVSQLNLGNDQVRKETQRLANVMGSSPKARGRWGEEQLKTILESAGLAENVDFFLQESVLDGEQQLRPDCVINLPGNRTIVIDVKCPLVAFEQAFEEEDETKRLDYLKKHASALKSYAADLGKKGYWKQFEKSPDFVILFVPGEHFLSAAAERAPKLIEDAFRDGVIIASTINMLALAKIMAGMWRQEALTSQAREIAALGKELHSRLQSMGSHVVSLGRNLRLATDSYDDFIGSLDRNVLTQAKRFESLKVAEGNKPLTDPLRIDFTPKLSSKLAESPAGADDKALLPAASNEDDAAA